MAAIFFSLHVYKILPPRKERRAEHRSSRDTCYINVARISITEEHVPKGRSRATRKD